MTDNRTLPLEKNKTNATVTAGLADRGRKAAAERAATTVEKIARAQRAIERDLEKYNGVYPYAGGRLSTEEVLRRAGLSETILQKRRHRALRASVNAWVSNLKKTLMKGRRVVRKAVTERVDSARDEIARIRQAWAEAELEYIEQANKITALTRKCAELENLLRILKSESDRGSDA
jgi:hypothetical protein